MKSVEKRLSPTTIKEILKIEQDKQLKVLIQYIDFNACTNEEILNIFNDLTKKYGSRSNKLSTSNKKD